MLDFTFCSKKSYKYLRGLSNFHYLSVGSKNGANSGSDASPPLQSFTEESSPENMAGSTPPLGIGNGRNMRTCQSTESLDSLSDESGGRAHNKSSSSRKVIYTYTKSIQPFLD